MRLSAFGLSGDETARLHVAVADQQVLIYALLRLFGDLVYDQNGDPRHPADEELERVRDILDYELPELRDELVCKCGHVMADHDEMGCTYIGCRTVCVKL